MSPFDAAVNDFCGHSSEIGNILDWMEERSVQILTERRFAQVNNIRAGCIVLLSSYFEEFLRNCVRSFCEEMQNNQKCFCDLPNRFQQSYIQAVARNLEKGTKGENWKSADAVIKAIDIGKNLSRLGGQPPYEFHWEELAQTRGNPGPEVVKELLKAFGIEDPWQFIDHDSSRLRSALTSFLEQRNLCAHGGSSGIPTDSEVIRTSIKHLQDLAEKIAKILDTHIASV